MVTAKCNDDDSNVVPYFGDSEPLDEIWIPELKAYRISRQEEGLANGTINWQMVTMNKMFTVLKQHRLVTQNPVRLLKRLSTREAKSHVYLSHDDVRAITEHCSDWLAQTIRAGHFGGMTRRGSTIYVQNMNKKKPRNMSGLDKLLISWWR